MMGIEIERKFLVNRIPFQLDQYPVREIEQGYLSVSPAIRVRRDNEAYYMTYKEIRAYPGQIGQNEYNLPLTKEAYEHMIAKADGYIIRKQRYLLPLNYDAYDDVFLQAHPDLARRIGDGSMKIELDVFAPSAPAPFADLVIAEIEYPSSDAYEAYRPAAWFAADVTGDPAYSNAQLSMLRYT